MTEDLMNSVAFVRQNSPFYQILYAGLPGSGLRLTDLPTVDSSSFWEANTVYNNRLLTAPIIDGIVYKTGGTTKEPRLSVYTRDEMRAVANIWGSGIASAGLCPGDRVANLYYAGELYASFINNLLALQEHPVPNVQLPIGVSASAEYSAEVIEELSATVIIGPTTSLCRVASYVTSVDQLLIPEYADWTAHPIISVLKKVRCWLRLIPVPLITCLFIAL